MQQQQHDTRGAIAALLSQTSAEHGAYEERELGGAYDQNWPQWYATYLVEHGLGDLLNAMVTSERLSGLLRAYDEAYRREPPAEGWPDYYARRLVEDVGQGRRRTDDE